MQLTAIGQSAAKKNRFKISVGTVMKYLIVTATSAFMILPFLWMLSASFKGNRAVFDFPIEWIPSNGTLENYSFVLQNMNLPNNFKNTLLVTIGVTAGQVFTCSMAAYAFSKIQFPERDGLFLGYLATMMVPFQVIMIPQFILMKNLHLSDSLSGLILLEAFSPFGVFLLVQSFKEVPVELSEAARIDGLNEFGIYSRIILPLSGPALSTLIITTAVKTWNEFLQPLIYLNSSSKYTVQLALRSLVSENTSKYGAIMAGSVLAVVPVIIFYFVMQRFFVESTVSSGVKG